MFIRFQKNTYELPDPVALPGEATLDVEKFYVFPQPASARENRFQFSHGPAKILFFLFREGLSLTVRKIRSAFLQQRVLSDKRVVLAIGTLRGSDSHAIAIGPQHCPSASVQTFPRAWTSSVSRDFDITTCRDMLVSHFDAHPGLFDEVFHYSSFSGLKVRFALNDVMHDEKTAGGSSRQGSGPDNPLVPASSAPKDEVPVRTRRLRGDAGNALFLIGAGAYAFAYILPFLRGVRHHTVVDLNPALAAVAAGKFGFVFADTSYERAFERLSECDSPLLVVATYHSTHMDIIEEALSYNPNTDVFLEKPPVTSSRQLHRLIELRKNGTRIEIGFNRRYAPFIKKAKSALDEEDGPIIMTCLIKELSIPLSHWYYWPTQGTRVTGNLCHWLDLGVFLIQRQPVSFTIVSALGSHPGDEITVIVLFDDGSKMTLITTDQGNPLRGVQEYLDIRRGNMTVTIDDFLQLTLQYGGSRKVKKSVYRDKGHGRMYREFAQTVACRGEILYPVKDLAVSTELYLKIADACEKGVPGTYVFNSNMLGITE
jgi:predicted dehydrogenase